MRFIKDEGRRKEGRKEWKEDLGKKDGMKSGLGKEGRNEKRTWERRKEWKEDFGKEGWKERGLQKERKKERRNEGGAPLTPPLLAVLNFSTPAHRYSTHRGYCSQPTTVLLRVLSSLSFFHCSSSSSSLLLLFFPLLPRPSVILLSLLLLMPSTIWLPCDLAHAYCCLTVAATDAQVRLLIFFFFFFFFPPLQSSLCFLLFVIFLARSPCCCSLFSF